MPTGASWVCDSHADRARVWLAAPPASPRSPSGLGPHLAGPPEVRPSRPCPAEQLCCRTVYFERGEINPGCHSAGPLKGARLLARTARDRGSKAVKRDCGPRGRGVSRNRAVGAEPEQLGQVPELSAGGCGSRGGRREGPGASRVPATAPAAPSLGTSGPRLIFQVAELGNSVFQRINTQKRSESGAARGLHRTPITALPRGLCF